MAIQVSSTTVIDNSRNLNNIAGADATTVSNLQAAGLGASTTAGAVGTYIWGRPASGTGYNFGDTATGVVPVSEQDLQTNAYWSSNAFRNSNFGSAQSGTWRAMSQVGHLSNQIGFMGLWVRIS